jgi:hypothetical protein
MKMKRTLFPLITFIALSFLILSGCDGDEPATETPTAEPTQPSIVEATPVPTPTEETPPAEPEYGEANVDSVQLLILESFPVQVNVLARGELPNGCTTVDEITTQSSGNEFQVTITTIRPGGVACTEALVPFEETISLDVLGLDAGQYSVSVNGISGSFTLDVDNRIPEEDTPEPTVTPTAEPVDSSSASISGIVWHDLCAVVPAIGDEEATPSDGCIATANGNGFRANGLLEDGEPGIQGILVDVGEGECPSSGKDTATTDENGNYSFTGLTSGTYCISVDALAEDNSEILVPGTWTFPNTDVDSISVTVDDGVAVSRVNFGWDYEFLPVPEVDTETCVNSITYVEDLTIPDDTVLQPGEEFVKSWRLRNSGTCPWTIEYSLMFVGGDVIPGPESVPLSGPVVPEQSVDLSVTLTAPDTVGTYRANWQISDAVGDPFGVGGLIEEAFWVQIIVAEPVATPAPNSGVIGGVVWADSCFIRSDGSPSVGCVETAEGSGSFIADGSLNNNEVSIPDLVIGLSEEACPDEGAIAASDIVATAATDENGLYRFTGLDGGTYCVSIDAFSEDNVDILIPGDWTWPAQGVGRITVVLDPGEERLEVDFGWDDR